MAIGHGHRLDAWAEACVDCRIPLRHLREKPDQPCALGLWPLDVKVPLREIDPRG